MHRYIVRKIRRNKSYTAPTWEVIDTRHPDHSTEKFNTQHDAIAYRDAMNQEG